MVNNARMLNPREFLRGLFDAAFTAAPGLSPEWVRKLRDHIERLC